MIYLLIAIISAVLLGASAAILTRAGEKEKLCKYNKEEDEKNDL